MTFLLLGAVWIHLAACILLTGSFALLAMAGPPTSPAIQRWEGQVLSVARWLVLVALISGIAWLAVRAALFEGRSEAALEGESILRGMLDTWPGIVWMVRHGLLIVLAALLWLGGDTSTRWDWVAAHFEAFLLSALALALASGSSHAAAISQDQWPRLVDTVHLLGAGMWAGGLPPLALLLFAASRGGAVPDAYAVRAMQRFSRVALATVLVLAASGTATALLLVGGLPGLVGTTHGRLLLSKLAILVPVLLLAAASRALLPRLSGPAETKPVAVARRMAWFIASEAGLVLMLLGLAAAMTITTPARHGDPVWPWSIRLSFQPYFDVWTVQNIAPIAGACGGALLLAILLLAWRRRAIAAGLVVVALAGGVALALPPLIVEAFPTSFTRPPVTYHAGSIAAGGRLYKDHCSACHDPASADVSLVETVVDLKAVSTARRSAGELLWMTTHGRPERGMPAFEDRLENTQRWHLINYVRAMEAANDPREIGTKVEPDNGWLIAPDFTISVGPLTPRTLREFRGRRMVLLVLYALPESRERMTELARHYQTLSVLGVEIVAVPPKSSAGSIAELGANPPTFFPVVTAGSEDINATYRLFAPGAAHAEFLIDRQGYIRAMWRSDGTGMPDAAAVQAEAERLNEEKAPPPLPDDHVH